MNEQVSPAEGKFGILMCRVLKAVATTFIAGVEAVKKGPGIANRLTYANGEYLHWKRNESNYPKAKDLCTYRTEDIVFGGWDIYEDNVFEAAINAKVINKMILHAIKPGT